MVELLTGQRSEAAQVQRPFDSAIASFCLGKNPRTKAEYERDLKKFSSYATRVGVSELGQLTPGHIDNYFEHCKKQNLPRATVKRLIASLSGLLLHSEMEELAKKTRDIGNKYIGSRPEIQPLHPLSKEEVERLQEVSQNNSRDAAIIAIALETGANITEILALYANNIVGVDVQILVEFGGKHKRIARLSRNASATVKKHKGDRRDDLPLFTKEQLDKRETKPLTRASLWGILRKYGVRIGRQDLSSRVLRETFIANIKREGSRELTKSLVVDRTYAYRLSKRLPLTQGLSQSGVLLDATTK